MFLSSPQPSSQPIPLLLSEPDFISPSDQERKKKRNTHTTSILTRIDMTILWWCLRYPNASPPFCFHPRDRMRFFFDPFGSMLPLNQHPLAIRIHTGCCLHFVYTLPSDGCHYTHDRHRYNSPATLRLVLVTSRICCERRHNILHSRSPYNDFAQNSDLVICSDKQCEEPGSDFSNFPNWSKT